MPHHISMQYMGSTMDCLRKLPHYNLSISPERR